MIKTQLVEDGINEPCWVVSYCGTWLTGSYKTKKLAEFAANLPEDVLEKAQLLANETNNGIIEEQHLKLNWSAALIEWESSGISDIPTANLKEFLDSITAELKKRGEPS